METTTVPQAEETGAEPAVTPEQIKLAGEYADGLTALAAMVRANPRLIGDFGYLLKYLSLPVDGKAEIAAFIRAGMASKAGIRKDIRPDSDFARVHLSFGPVQLQIVAERNRVCERIVVGTREVVEEVPDPEALVAVPKVQVTKTVEDVRWECRPLLAESGAGA